MSTFAKRLIAWQRQAGRHDLPWQNTRDPYRIWLSEIMLQQTQVAAVIPYYTRFLAAFPTLQTLASAPVDEVMRLWSGLGYYARARNLHTAAKLIMEQHQGAFPRGARRIEALPGIGRSTAAAISVFAYGEVEAILDGNVRRVFARHFGVAGDVRSKSVEAQLWELAIRELPQQQIEAYTQGLMDLGSSHCTRQSPLCGQCPVNATCIAHREGRTDTLPGKAARKQVPHRQIQMLVLVAQGEVLLEKRPPRGIWGGLWSLPEATLEEDVWKIAHTRFGISTTALAKRQSRKQNLAVVQHAFTHYTLDIHPVLMQFPIQKSQVTAAQTIWINLEDAQQAALPAPVKRILHNLSAEFITMRQTANSG